jgi:acetyl esterase/lipase
MYAADAFLDHPLVSVLRAASWEGCPPVYICTGRELLTDEDKFVASRLHSDGVRVVFEEYEAMPHCFALVMPKLKGAARCMDGWSGFIGRVVGEGVEGVQRVESAFTRVEARTLKEVKLDPSSLSPFTIEEVAERVRKQIEVMCAPQAGEKAKL